MNLPPKWADSDFSVLVYIDPPKGADTDSIVNYAQKWKGRVDGFMLSDNADAIMRMTPICASRAVLDQGIRPVLRMNTRDRNRLAIQGDLLGAWALGIRDVVVLKGKDPSYGDHPLTRQVYDLSETEMVEMVKGLNAGKDMAGNTFSSTTGFHIGAAVDWLDDDKQVEAEFENIQKMADAGVDFIVTSPMFDISRARELTERAKGMGVSVFVGIMLLKSVGMARYLNEVPGIAKVPDALIAQMADAPVKPRAGVDIAAQAIEQLKGAADGVVLMPIGWERKIPDLLEAIGR